MPSLDIRSNSVEVRFSKFLELCRFSVGRADSFNERSIWSGEVEDLGKVCVMLASVKQLEAFYQDIQGMMSVKHKAKVGRSRFRSLISSINLPTGQLSLTTEAGVDPTIDDKSMASLLINLKFLQLVLRSRRVLEVEYLENYLQSILKLAKNCDHCREPERSAIFLPELKWAHKKLSEDNQEWLLVQLQRLLKSEKSSNAFLESVSNIRLKIYPEDALETSMYFLEFLTNLTIESGFKDELCQFLAALLIHIRADSQNDFINLKFSKCLSLIRERLTSTPQQYPIKLSESMSALKVAAICLSGASVFQDNNLEMLSLILNKIKDRSYTSGSFLILAQLLWTNFYIYSDAWAVYLDFSETLLGQILPSGKKSVVGCDENVLDVVRFLEVIVEKLPRFGLIEIVKRLLKQFQDSLSHENLENFTWDRINIATRILLNLAKKKPKSTFPEQFLDVEDESGWRDEFLMVEIGELSLEPVYKECCGSINTAVEVLIRHYWQSNSNSIMIDETKTKMISFLTTLLKTFPDILEPRLVLGLRNCNILNLKLSAEEAWRIKIAQVPDKTPLIQLQMGVFIGNLIFGQLEVIKAVDEESWMALPDDWAIVDFFIKVFNGEEKNEQLKQIAAGLMDSEVLRASISHLHENRLMWSHMKLKDSQVRLKSAEIEHFGKVLEANFLLYSRFASLFKEIYLEIQGKNSFLWRSWNALVGFKKNSRETADFLASLLGYEDGNLRLRVLRALELLPSSRLNEFIKLFETFRLPVSDDFVNLRYFPTRRNRRHERNKLEVTRLYRSLLIALENDFDISEHGTALKVISRHIVELYYFVSKIELDDYVWQLRGELIAILIPYLTIVNHIMTHRSNFFPSRFHCEVWSSVLAWNAHRRQDHFEDLMAQLSVQYLSSAEIIKTCEARILSDVMEVVGLFENSQQKSGFIFNVISSGPKTISQVLFDKLLHSSCAMEPLDENVVEGLFRVLNEKEDDFDFDRSSIVLTRLLMNEAVKDVSYQAYCGILNKIVFVDDRIKQRKLLQMLSTMSPSGDGDQSEIKDLIEAAFGLTEKLKETFPQSIIAIWTLFLGSDSNRFCFLVHFLLKTVQKSLNSESTANFVFDVALQICEALTLKILLKYIHPYSGMRRQAGFERSPCEAILHLLQSQNNSYERFIRLIDVSQRGQFRLLCHLSSVITGSSSEDGGVCFAGHDQVEIDIYCCELLMWATQCPLKQVNQAAWRELKSFSGRISDAFVETLLASTRKFLQHLVFPGTLHYFDPLLIVEIFDIFLVLLEENDQISTMSILNLFSYFVDQMKSVDLMVFEAASRILCSCLEFEEIWDFLSTRPVILLELLQDCLIVHSSPELSFSLLIGDLQKLEHDSSEEGGSLKRYFGHLIAFLPTLFILFNEQLSTDLKSPIKKQKNADVFDEHLNVLISLTDELVKTCITDEMVQLVLLDLRYQLISVEQRRCRPSSDFYKSMALLLADSVVLNFSFEPLLQFLSFKVEDCDFELFKDFMFYWLEALSKNKSLKAHFDASVAIRLVEKLAVTSEACEHVGAIDFLVSLSK